jgi:hypothetical protein
MKTIHHLCPNFVVATSTWPDIIYSVDRRLLVTDIWIRSIVTLMFVLDEQKANNALHLISIP